MYITISALRVCTVSTRSGGLVQVT